MANIIIQHYMYCQPTIAMTLFHKLPEINLIAVTIFMSRCRLSGNNKPKTLEHWFAASNTQRRVILAMKRHS